VTAALLAGLAALGARHGVASACGGFFCDSGGPQGLVLQAREDILFVQDGDRIEAQVAVAYQGGPDEFAWIVPVPSEVEVDVGSPYVFTQLAASVSPRFTYTVTSSEFCSVANDGGVGCSSEDAAVGSSSGRGEDTDSPGGDTPGVEVIRQEQVGPYDYTVLAATSTSSMLEWLAANDYDIPPETASLLEPYVLMGDQTRFVALKLQKGASVGELQPVVLRYTDEQPMIPIQLTAVAAVQDMGIQVTVVGDDRAVPQNYLSVEPNWSRIDWRAGGANYETVAGEAIEEAGGRAFVTEFAGTRSDLPGVEDFGLVAFDADRIRAIDGGSLALFQQQVRASGMSWDANVIALVTRYLDVAPDVLARNGITLTDIATNPELYAPLPGTGSTFDVASARDELLERLVLPHNLAVERIAGRYLTRLYTRLSPAEMTVDPVFVQAPGLAPVANTQAATARNSCFRETAFRTTISIPGGRVIEASTGGFGVPGGLQGAPAASRVLQYDARGAESVVIDNTAGVDAAIGRSNAAELRAIDPADDCRVAPGVGRQVVTLAPVVLGLLLMRRRALRVRSAQA
jgi:hypothetical protein